MGVYQFYVVKLLQTEISQNWHGCPILKYSLLNSWDSELSNGVWHFYGELRLSLQWYYRTVWGQRPVHEGQSRRVLLIKFKPEITMSLSQDYSDASKFRTFFRHWFFCIWHFHLNAAARSKTPFNLVHHAFKTEGFRSVTGSWLGSWLGPRRVTPRASSLRKSTYSLIFLNIISYQEFQDSIPRRNRSFVVVCVVGSGRGWVTATLSAKLY